MTMISRTNKPIGACPNMGVRKPLCFKQNKTPKDPVDRLSTQSDALQLGGRIDSPPFFL